MVKELFSLGKMFQIIFSLQICTKLATGSHCLDSDLDRNKDKVTQIARTGISATPLGILHLLMEDMGRSSPSSSLANRKGGGKKTREKSQLPMSFTETSLSVDLS